MMNNTNKQGFFARYAVAGVLGSTGALAVTAIAQDIGWSLVWMTSFCMFLFAGLKDARKLQREGQTCNELQPPSRPDGWTHDGYWIHPNCRDQMQYDLPTFEDNA